MFVSLSSMMKHCCSLWLREGSFVRFQSHLPSSFYRSYASQFSFFYIKTNFSRLFILTCVFAYKKHGIFWVGRVFKDPVVPTALAPIMTDNGNIIQNMHVSRKCSAIAITLCKGSVRFHTPTDLQCSPQSSAISCILSPMSCILLSVQLPQHYLPVSLLWYMQYPDVANVMSRSF